MISKKKKNDACLTKSILRDGAFLKTHYFQQNNIAIVIFLLLLLLITLINEENKHKDSYYHDNYDGNDDCNYRERRFGRGSAEKTRIGLDGSSLCANRRFIANRHRSPKRARRHSATFTRWSDGPCLQRGSDCWLRRAAGGFRRCFSRFERRWPSMGWTKLRSEK